MDIINGVGPAINPMVTGPQLLEAKRNEIEEVKRNLAAPVTGVYNLDDIKNADIGDDTGK